VANPFIKPSNFLSTEAIAKLYAGAYDPLNALTHTRWSQPKWRFPLCGLLSVILPFMILAWGTAYKLSLYKSSVNGAPAKVCTRGSDAAKSGVSAAIDGRKIVGTGLMPSLPVKFRLATPEPIDVALSDATQIVLPLQSAPVHAARPPPIRFLFS
jgi:hypothetical protein